MGLQVNEAALRREQALRGWSLTEFAKRARVSVPTLSHALAGRPIAPGTFRAIVQALEAEPPLATGAQLLVSPGVAEAKERAAAAAKPDQGSKNPKPIRDPLQNVRPPAPDQRRQPRGRTTNDPAVAPRKESNPPAKQAAQPRRTAASRTARPESGLTASDPPGPTVATGRGGRC